MFSKGDGGPRRSNSIEEDYDLKQKKQIKVEQSDRFISISRLIYRPVDCTVDSSRLGRYREGLVILQSTNKNYKSTNGRSSRLICMISRLIMRSEA